MQVIDITIGLVLIYFLYSLLSSIIAEILSSWIGMRARMLKQGIGNILNDKNIGSRQDFKKWIQDIFLVEDSNFKYTNAGKFYGEPNIKYLAKPGVLAWYSFKNRKPSYISHENFVVTILNMFSNKGRGISEWDKIKFAIETNSLHLEPETLKMFQDLVKRSDDKFELFVDLLQNYFADTMDRVNGWYKRKIGMIIFFIGLIMCTIFNVDTIQIVKTLGNDKEKRLKMVELADRVVNQKSAIDSLMTKQDTLAELKYKMEAHAMVKQSVLEANDIMALGWDFKIGKRVENTCVSDDPTCYPCLKVKDALILNRLIRKDSVFRVKIKSLQFIIDNTFPEDTTFLSSPDIKQLYKEVIPSLDISKSNTVLLDSIGRMSKRLDAKQIKMVMDKQNAILKAKNISHDSMVIISGLPFTRFDSISKSGHYRNIEGQGYPTLSTKSAFVIKAMLPWKSKFWGIIITTLALTLGAQFWFDLLKKLTSIRSAGTKPEENEEKKKQVEKLKLTGDKITSRDPVEIAISENRGYWESLPGFIGHNVMTDKKEIRFIEISLDEEIRELKPVDDKVTVFSSDSMGSIDIIVKYKLFGKGRFENSLFNFKGAIKQSATGAIGTPAGIVMNNKTGKLAILTCGHVARIDNSTFLSDKRSKVYFYNGIDWNSEIGETTNIVISSFCDGGVIDITNYQNGLNLKFIKEFRKIDSLLKSEKYKLHSVRGVKKVDLYDKNFYTTIRDSGGIFHLRMLQLLVFESNSKNDYSIPGDSGSLVTDDKDCPIGIHIGGYESSSTKFCYVVHMQDLMEILQISPIQNI